MHHYSKAPNINQQISRLAPINKLHRRFFEGEITLQLRLRVIATHRCSHAAQRGINFNDRTRSFERGSRRSIAFDSLNTSDAMTAGLDIKVNPAINLFPSHGMQSLVVIKPEKAGLPQLA